MDHQSFPTSWGLQEDLQRSISSLELLAQTALLICQTRVLGPCRGRIALRQHSDNTASEAAANRLFSSTPPFSHFCLNLAQQAFLHHCNLSVDHIEGARNDIADGLSRSYALTLQSLNPARRINLTLADILFHRRGVRPSPPDLDTWPRHLRSVFL